MNLGENMTLIVMAAGLGSRFGGLKQMQPITSDGRVILDFSVYDAIQAGFTKVVFVIRKETHADFKRLIGDRITKKIQVEYVFQDESKLPKNRKKPFGTGHAIYCCKDVVSGPFAIINADDYYGKNAFLVIKEHLVKAKRGEFAMVGYALKNTLSKNGSVSRGVCTLENGFLKWVDEIKEITPNASCEKEGKTIFLPEDSLVSMNLWGLTPDIFERLESTYENFFKTANLEKDEIYIHSVISEMIQEGIASVKVFKTTDKWYGVTHRADLEEIKNAIGGYIKNGLYEGI